MLRDVIRQNLRSCGFIFIYYAGLDKVSNKPGLWLALQLIETINAVGAGLYETIFTSSMFDATDNAVSIG